jgi:hypothetical protein
MPWFVNSNDAFHRWWLSGCSLMVTVRRRTAHSESVLTVERGETWLEMSATPSSASWVDF